MHAMTTHDNLQSRIKRRRAFESVREEVYLSLLLTVSLLDSDVNAIFKERDLSPPTYNVLRILSGDDESLTCGEIGDRMIARVPDVTRLIDRLEARDLVTRKRSNKDRRVVRVSITPAGRNAIEGLGDRLIELHESAFASLSEDEANQIVTLLARVRDGIETNASGSEPSSPARGT